MVLEIRKYVAEFVGTFALVFCGTGAIVINEVSNGTVGHLGIGLTFGLIVMGMVYSFGHVSGAHLNPAVTLGLWLTGKFKGGQILPYIVVQILGAILASGMLRLIFPEADTLGETLPAGSDMQSFFLELILTYFLMLVILQSTSGPKEQAVLAGLAIGGIVGLEATFAGPICGASMNPARSIGPALVNMNLEQLWIYIAAPILGAVLAVGTFKITRPMPSEEAT